MWDDQKMYGNPQNPQLIPSLSQNNGTWVEVHN